MYYSDLYGLALNLEAFSTIGNAFAGEGYVPAFLAWELMPNLIKMQEQEGKRIIYDYENVYKKYGLYPQDQYGRYIRY